jgi:hypothetical protein
MIDPYEIVLRDGHKVDRLTDGALKRAEKILGYPLTVRQGSYNPGKVAASAGTHDEGGVVDLMPWDRENKVKALRAVGFAAWYRPTIPGLWGAHIHAVLLGHAKLAPSAIRQALAYLNHRNGLRDNGPDVDPGWTNTARYTADDLRADVRREAITERVQQKRLTIAKIREQVAVIRAQVKRLVAKRDAL